MQKKKFKFLVVVMSLMPGLLMAKEIEVRAPSEKPLQIEKAAIGKEPKKAAPAPKKPEEKKIEKEPSLGFEKVPPAEKKAEPVENPGKTSSKALPNIFSLPDSLKKNVDFWRKIYSHYDSHQVVFYDTVNPNAIYDVLDLPKVQGEISSPKYRDQVQQRSQEIAKTLDLLSGPSRPKSLSSFEQQIDDVIKKNKLADVADLSKRFRGQNGLKSQFALGLIMSGRYADEVKKLLRARNVPEELVAIVFVESLWNLSASSHAGASGPWGIVRETALRSGIHVNRFTDERLDPLLATLAAAEFLAKAKGGLEEWPLAITAYNYGYAGMLRAKANLETKNIEEIIEKHVSPIFGYASKNYYTEFLAALEVYINHEKYFPGLVLEKPWNYELVQILRPIAVNDLLASGALSKTELAYYNPGLTKYTINGQEVIPQEFSLRVPKGKAKFFYDRLKKIPSARREEAKWKISTKYHARGNESIDYIARKHGIIGALLGDLLKQPLHYKPKGAINIRSFTYAFSQLKKIVEDFIQPGPPSRVARTP